MCRVLVYVLLEGAVLAVIAAGPAHAELIGHWKFDESYGTTARDSAGRDNDGILFGDVR